MKASQNNEIQMLASSHLGGIVNIDFFVAVPRYL
jgi:hypothetical protein